MCSRLCAGLAHADATVTDLRHDSVFGDARHNLRHARAVLIIPGLVKGGFIFGAEGGDGVLLARTRHGWSSPAFYSLGSASFGLQIGLEQAQLVMIIMTDRALRDRCPHCSWGAVVVPVTESFVRALPKVELHLHLLGSVSPQTVVGLAARHVDSSVPTDVGRLRGILLP